MSCAAKPSNTALSERHWIDIADGDFGAKRANAPCEALADRAVADDGDVLTVECMLAENALHGGHAMSPQWPWALSNSGFSTLSLTATTGR